jgi:hypothetical protein
MQEETGRNLGQNLEETGPNFPHELLHAPAAEEENGVAEKITSYSSMQNLKLIHLRQLQQVCARADSPARRTRGQHVSLVEGAMELHRHGVAHCVSACATCPARI